MPRATPLLRLSLQAFLVVACAAATANAQPYRVVTLQPLPGDTIVSNTSTNNSGVTVGISSGPSGMHFVSWGLNGQPTPLPVPPYTQGIVINNSGVIAGTRGLAPPVQGRFVFQPGVPFLMVNGQAVDFPAPPNDLLSAAFFTDTGILVFAARTLQFWKYYALYAGTLFELDLTLVIRGVSDAGLIGGVRLDGTPFLQRPGGPIVRPWPEDVAVDSISPVGHVAGALNRPFATSVPIHYQLPGGALWRFEVPALTIALGGMNRAGDLVATHTDQAFQQTALLFRNGQLVDLTALAGIPGERLIGASHITDTGIVVGVSQGPDPDAPVRVELLLPTVPLPPSMLAFSLRGRTVTLTWNGSPGATNYIVEAGTGPGLSNLYRAGVGLQTALVATASPGRYYVRVRSHNDVGDSDPSNEAIVDIP